MKDLGDNTIFRIDWQEVFPVVLLPRALRITLSFRVLVFTLIAVMSSLLLATAAYKLWPEEKTLEDWTVLSDQAIGMLNKENTLPPPSMDNMGSQPWGLLTMPGFNLYKNNGDSWCARAVWFVVFLIIWSLFGAVITRSVAVRFACNQREEFRNLRQFVITKWGSYLGAVLMPMVGIAICLVPLWMIAVFWSMNWTILVAIFFPIALIFAFFALILAVGLVLGWPLMFAAISTEGSDAFDAIGRAYSYVYQRPIQFFFYHGVNHVILWVGTLVVALIVQGIISISRTHGCFPESSALMVTKDSAEFLLFFWSWLLEMLVVAFPFAYFWVSSTVIYFLLRRSCDATPLEEVYRMGASAVKRTLPPVTKKDDGTPEISSAPPTENQATGNQE